MSTVCHRRHRQLFWRDSIFFGTIPKYRAKPIFLLRIANLGGRTSVEILGCPIICKNLSKLSVFAYKKGMASFNEYLDSLLSHGRGYFSRAEGIRALGLSTESFSAAATRLIKKKRLASPRHGFFLILRPEDRIAGAPDPIRWIDPLMKHQETDYRISLLRAAAFHGSSHQASMVFQVVVPRQLRDVALGRHRLQFVYQAPQAFEAVNRAEWLDQIKSDAGFAKVAGVELTMLDASRYFHKAAGINGVAQIVHDIGAKADPRKLAKAADAYENSAVRRLGYLLDLYSHRRQAGSLAKFVSQAKSVKQLDPSVRSLATLKQKSTKDSKWMLNINQEVEIDT